MIKNCLFCKKEFVTYQYLLKKGYGKYCSRNCSSKSQTKGLFKLCPICKRIFFVHLFRHKEGKGHYCSSKCFGESLWINGKPTKKSIHQFIKRSFGKPSYCEICKKTQGNFEWANIDHKYNKKRKYWIRLCRSCHRKYDIKNNNYKLFGNLK